MAGLGMLVAPLARHLVRSCSLLRNFMILTVLTLAGLAGVALRFPHWGRRVQHPACRSHDRAGEHIVSNTLNTHAHSAQRATVLSFKGLVFPISVTVLSV